MKIVVKGNIGYVKLELPDDGNSNGIYYMCADSSHPKHKKLIEIISSICKEVKEIDTNASETE